MPLCYWLFVSSPLDGYFAIAASSHVVGYHKKGYPKQKPKNGSDPKQKLERQTGSQPKISDSPEASSPRPLRPRPPRRGLRRSTNSPIHPRPPRRGLQFSDSPEAPSPLTSLRPPLSSQASAGPPILRLARGRLGSTPPPLPSPVPLTKRRVALTQPTAAPDTSRMLGTVPQSD